MNSTSNNRPAGDSRVRSSSVTRDSVSTAGSIRRRASFSSYSPRATRYSDSSASSRKIPIHKRNIGIVILFEILSLGFYSIYLDYLLVKNNKALKNDFSSAFAETLCLIFVPFYFIYWSYTRGLSIKEELEKRNLHPVSNGILYLVLSILPFFFIVQLLMQHDFNSLPPSACLEKRFTNGGRAIGRTLVILLTLIVILVAALFSVCATIAKGPSTTMRDQLVLSAMQASATKWVPGLFLDKETVDGIVAASHVTVPDVIPLDQYSEYKKGQVGGKETSDEPDWSQAHDGILYFTTNGPSYKAYIMLVKDPSRVFVGVAQFQSGAGIRIFEAVEKYSTQGSPVVAGINAGEYLDAGGQGTGDLPIGITFSQGKEVWYDGIVSHTFFGFDRNNKLIVKEGMTRAEANELGIRDGVSFQWGNTLIQNDGTSVQTFYAPDNIARAQRTAIGQRADGTVILLTTDGRSAASLGATRNDVIDMMIRYGAVTAGLLDGGSSAMMYYRNYWDILGMDYNALDEYQKMGLVNKYKAFTPPRKMPSYFLVSSPH